MKRNLLTKVAGIVLAGAMVFGMTACGNSNAGASSSAAGSSSAAAAGKTFKIGLCNYVDDASLNQICDNIQAQLKQLGTDKGVTFEVKYENCNADATVMNQIIKNFEADKVDLMIGVATPVAMAMQAATEDSKTPVIFSAVSDPVGAKLVASLEAPGSNITGTSDYLDTAAVMNLILAANKDTKKVGLLFDQGQDSSTQPIADAKKFLEGKGIKVVEKTGTTVDEVKLAVDALISEKVDAIFTPTDNTIMTAELSIYKKLADAKIPHYTGADSFALNGAFLGYGVDYANLGVETANMVAKVLVDGAKPAELKVMTFDNGTATVNTETCAAIGYDLAKIKEVFAPLCTKVNEITTAEKFQ